MPTEAVKIPQNVQIEDKIVGPLSLRQIIITGVGAGFSYMLYSGVQKSYGHVSIPLAILLWLPAVVAAAFAIVNINDLSLTRICFLFFERLQKPSQRTWAPREGITVTIRTSSFRKEEEAKKIEALSKRPSTETQISELTGIVDRNVADYSSVDAAPPAQPTIAAEQRTAVADKQVLPVITKEPKPPVNPDRIRVDAPRAPSMPELSDLSVFRDIFPSNTSWQA